MSAITLFEEKQVCRAWNSAEEQWYFAIADVIAVLTDSVDPGAYWRKLKDNLRDQTPVRRHKPLCPPGGEPKLMLYPVFPLPQ